ncbi:S-adenosyl-L-methionine-dependent methyltransferase [Phycomyces blakesleeanus]
MPRWTVQQTQWIRQLLPVCDHDAHLAQRQLAWLKEKVLADHRGSSTLESRLISHLSVAECNQLDEHVKERANNKPLQYILGTQPFCDLEIVTRPPVLIPRWETEEWTSRLIDILKPHAAARYSKENPLRVLDVCTGSGCIALAMSAHLPAARASILGLDIGSEAIDLARHNLKVLDDELQNPVEFRQQDIFDPVKEPFFDVVVSNPPYITTEEYAVLDADVKDWEDERALVALEDGTRVHKRIIEVVSAHTKPNDSNNDKNKNIEEREFPRLIMEMGGSHQVDALSYSLEKHGFRNISVWKDLADKDRVIVGY